MQSFVTFLSMAIAIFTAELGDKTQLFVMGLAAKEKMRNVFWGMSIAILILNLMAVYLGVMLSNFVRPELIRLVSGFAFLIFAYLSLSATKEEEKTGKVRRFAVISIAALFFMAELGDKTQLSVIALAAQNPQMRMWIFLGAMAGMMLADGIGIILGLKLGKKLPETFFQRAAFAIFALFGIVSIGESIDLLMPGRAAIPTLVIAAVYLVLVFFGRRKR